MPRVVRSDDPMVDADAIDAMQDHAVLVNTGRGGLIDEEVLAGGGLPDRIDPATDWL